MVSNVSSIDRQLSEFAARHDNIVTWSELRALGLHRSTVDRLVRDGWLHRLARGTYLVGTSAMSDRGRLRAAVVSNGRGACLTRDATLATFEVVAHVPRTIDVIVGSAVWGNELAVIHRSRQLHPADVTVHGGLPTVTVERALVDLSPDRGPLRLLKHMRTARYRGCLDVQLLAAVVDRLKHRGTCDNVRRALRYFSRDDGGADSWLEERFHRHVLTTGIRDPRSNVHVEGLRPGERVDFVWDAERVVVEVDGPHHLDPTVATEDRRRDRRLGASGWRVLRFWWWEIEERPVSVMRRLGAALT